MGDEYRDQMVEIDLLLTLDALIDAGFEELTVSPPQWRLLISMSKRRLDIEVDEIEVRVGVPWVVVRRFVAGIKYRCVPVLRVEEAPPFGYSLES